jgi:tetratricopeptide (TPR) repeat protein
VLAHCGAIVVALACATPIAAAPETTAVKQAKAHYAQGRADQDAGAWDDAVAEYQAAYKLAPLPKFLFNIGQCQRLKGDKQKAIEAYEGYLAAAPEGELSDEARDHVASLKLRIQVEEAEAARKRADEEAAAARAKAQAIEEADRRLREESAHRVAPDDGAQTRHLVEMMAEAEQRKRVDEEQARRARVATAQRVGLPLRIAGGAAAGLGLVIGLSAFAIIPDGNAQGKITQNATGTWTPADQKAYDKGRSDSREIIALWGTGIALLGVGAVVGITGAVLRSRAIGRAQASLVPLLSPSSAGLAVSGAF